MKGRLFWRISVCILLFDLFCLASQEKGKPFLVTPDQLTFIPSTYFVGDRVTLRFSFDLPSWEELHPLHSMPSLPWGIVHQMNLLPLKGKKGYEVTIVFTPYRTGRQLFPYLEFGPVRLEQIPVQVSSLLPTTREVPQPIREQMMIPHMSLLFVLGVGVFLAIPLLYLVWEKRFHSAFFPIWERYREKRLYRQLLRKLDQLEHEISTIEPKAFYSSLQENLRYYLSHRWNPKVIAYTTTEIGIFLGQVVAGKTMVTNDPGSILLEIFQRGDAVKFAGWEVSSHVLHSDILLVRRGVEEVERTFWAQRKKVRG
ncbi:MAG: hypothetical protein N2442_07150 [Spirochaetes bacterium]|nr:hypothetical protein [Spirochaetota bacterium]